MSRVAVTVRDAAPCEAAIAPPGATLPQSGFVRPRQDDERLRVSVWYRWPECRHRGSGAMHRDPAARSRCRVEDGLMSAWW